MKTSQRGIDFIKGFESFSPVPYVCSAGKTTIGYGHVIKAGESLVTLTLPQANELLARDLERFETAVLSMVDVSLTQTQFDALVAFAFNVGESALAGSTLLRKLNAGEYLSAAEEFKRWNKATDPKTRQKVELAGLTRRRNAESEMFLETE